jgi:hypothetical protein
LFASQQNVFVKPVSIRLSLALLIVLFVCSYANCNKPPYVPDYNNVKGFVIGKETCHTNAAKDYWLIDLTYRSDTPQYGDTLFLNGVTYTNVIKTKGLNERLKEIGMKVSLDFKIITPERIETTECNIADPITYRLKELFIINQGEIR